MIDLFVSFIFPLDLLGFAWLLISSLLYEIKFPVVVFQKLCIGVSELEHEHEQEQNCELR